MSSVQLSCISERSGRVMFGVKHVIDDQWKPACQLFKELLKNIIALLIRNYQKRKKLSLRGVYSNYIIVEEILF